MEEENNAAEEDPQFEMTPEQATGMGGGAPGLFNRKRVLVALCIFFAAVVCGGLVLNTARPKKKAASATEAGFSASNTPSEFLSSLRDRAVSRREQAPEREAAGTGSPRQQPAPEPEPLLPPVSFGRPAEAEPPRAPPGPAAAKPAAAPFPPGRPAGSAYPFPLPAGAAGAGKPFFPAAGPRRRAGTYGRR